MKNAADFVHVTHFEDVNGDGHSTAQGSVDVVTVRERKARDNVMCIVHAGVCTGCGACTGCEHIQFRPGELGFDTPQVEADCTQCGNCVKACCFDQLAEEDK